MLPTKDKLTKEDALFYHGFYSKAARDAKDRGELRVAEYYKSQIPNLKFEPTAAEKQAQRDFYSQAARDAKARGETRVAEYYTRTLASM